MRYNFDYRAKMLSSGSTMKILFFPLKIKEFVPPIRLHFKGFIAYKFSSKAFKFFSQVVGMLAKGMIP